LQFTVDNTLQLFQNRKKKKGYKPIIIYGAITTTTHNFRSTSPMLLTHRTWQRGSI